MIFRSLKYFIALSREHHFGRAAALCQVSQPTLSTSIKQLEDELEVPLVMRGQRFLGLTPEGERVLKWAERIVADEDAMRQELSELRDGLEGRLRLGVVPTALPAVPGLTGPFSLRHPAVSVSIRSLSSQEIQKALDNFEIDIGLTYLDNEPLKRVKAQPLYCERYALLVPAGSAFIGRATVTWKEAAAQPLCLLSPDMQNRRIIDEAFAEAGTTATPKIETNSITSLGLHVATGQWSAIVPRHFVVGIGAPEGSQAIALTDPDVAHDVGIIIADREPLPPAAKAMLQVVNETDGANLFDA